MKYTGVKAAREFVHRVVNNDPSLPLPDSTGHFSRVWDMGDKVLKISGCAGFGNNNIDPDDADRCDGWRWFAAYVVANPCKFFPVVHHYEESEDADVVWAVMDKLHHVMRPAWGTVDVAADRRYDRMIKWSDRVEGALCESTYREFKVVPVWLRKLVEAAAEFRAGDESCLNVDIHSANVMQDRHGRLILNDPFGFSV